MHIILFVIILILHRALFHPVPATFSVVPFFYLFVFFKHPGNAVWELLLC